MPTFVPLVPQPQRSGANSRSSASAVEPTFNAPVRWTLRVLAWLAFGVASYLAWSAITNTSVAGCGVGSDSGCDLVLTSSWSKWLGIPVAVLGLGCYASLAALSVLLGLRSEPANRWITTAFVLLAIVAACASIWFIGIQIFAIGHLCKYCLVTDTCGLAIGVIATTFAVRAVYAQSKATQPRAMQPGLMALKTAMPNANRNLQTAPRPEPAAPPSLIPAVCGAIPVIALLIGGQILFPSKTFGLEKVALKNSIEMDGSKPADTGESTTATGSTHVAMRVPTESDPGERLAVASDTSKANPTPAASSKEHNATANGQPTGKSAATDQKTVDASQSPSVPAVPAKQRLIKVLNGKLTLDVYQHPIIGSPEAPHIAIEMISYDCPHCRKMYSTMRHAMDRYGDQVAILIMVIPMEKECNKLITDPVASHQGACATAKLALGVAKLNPSAFAAFHDFLMSTKDKPPAMSAIIPKAYVLADRSQLRQLTQGEELTKHIGAYVDLFGQLQKQNTDKKEFGLPVQILGDYVMSGSVEKEEDVFKAWEEHLGVKPN